MKPHVFCLMPTRGVRRWCIARSIACWLKQDYENRSLCILDDADGKVRDLVPTGDSRIWYAKVKRQMTLGEKYNRGCRLAPVDSLIALWADDDWHHPQRLSFVVDAMLEEKADVGGTISMLCYRVPTAELFLYTHPKVIETDERDEENYNSWVCKPYLLGGTMIFPRDEWKRVKFPHIQRASDTVFVHELLTQRNHLVRTTQINEPRLYVAWVGHDNTGNDLMTRNADEGSTIWKRTRFKGGLRGVMGPDADLFGVPEGIGDLLPEQAGAEPGGT